MFTSAGMSQWPSMFTRPSGELHDSGEELFSLIAFVLLLAWAWSNGGLLLLGELQFSNGLWFVLPSICCRFAFFSFSQFIQRLITCIIVKYANRKTERERERGERKQQTASCCPISIHLHSRLFFELAQTNLKRFMVIAISPDNELS